MNSTALVKLNTAVQLREHYVAAATAYDDDPRASEYRRLTSQKRDLPPLQYDRALQLSFSVFQRNPLASRIIQTLVDFCFGDEFNVKIRKMTKSDEGDKDMQDPEPQRIWDKFYGDPMNNLEYDLKLFGQDFLINGELLIPPFVSTENGSVTLGYFDPLNVDQVVVNPKNIREVQKVMMRVGETGEKIPYTVVHHDNDIGSPSFGHMVGELFYWRLNHVTNQTRGQGHLVKLLDWLDSLDQFFFDALEGFRQRNAFMWDVTMQGATEQEIKEAQKNLRPPRPGTARAHNDKVTWSILTPDLKAIDIKTALLAVEGFIVGADAFPLHCFGSGEDANRATSEAMATPTMRMLKAVQRSMKRVVKEMAQYVIDQAVIAGMLTVKEDEYIDCQVNMFDFERRDSAVIGVGMVQVVNALTIAKDQGWLGDDTAKRICDGFVGRLGVETDPNETVEQIKAKNQQQKDEGAYDGTDPFPGKKNDPTKKGAQYE